MSANGQHPPVFPRPTVAMTESPSGKVSWKCTRCRVKGSCASLDLAWDAWRAHDAKAHP